jgi:WD40 repeat protein
VGNEDETHGFEGFLVDRARRKQAAQQAPTRAHDISRVARFDGTAPSTRWLSAARSPDGSQVAVGGRNLSGKHGELEIWNGHTGHHEGHGTRHLRHDLAGPVVSMSWAPNGTHLAAIEKDVKSGLPVLNVRSQAEGKHAVALPEGTEMEQVTWSPDGSLLALSSRNAQTTLLVDPVSGQLPTQRRPIPVPITFLSILTTFAPDLSEFYGQN